MIYDSEYDKKIVLVGKMLYLFTVIISTSGTLIGPRKDRPIYVIYYFLVSLYLTCIFIFRKFNKSDIFFYYHR